MHRVLLCGAGQLGSRHLQGLKRSSSPKLLFIQDPNNEALFFAKQRWNESQPEPSPHKVFFGTKFPEIGKKIDLAIIATNAGERPGVVQSIIGRFDVKYWILEKVLAQNMEGIEDLRCICRQKSLAWVNLPRRVVPWYNKIRARIPPYSLIQLKVFGGPWGLACNAIHFFDFVEWFSGEKLVEVITDRLDSHWDPAKRNGHLEVFGTLEGKFSKGSVVYLSSSREGAPSYQYELSDGKTLWLINEEAGLAHSSNGEKIEGRLPYQSEMTGPLVDELFATGRCQLPSLESSMAAHLIYLKAMLRHWRDHHDPQAAFVPIT